MQRAAFYLPLQLGTIDRIRDAGGVDLVGFYVTLASYQDGQAGDGRLIFNTTTGAITTLGMSRERYYKLKAQLEALGLYHVAAGRIYIGEAPVRIANDAVRNSDTVVRIPNAVMSLSQEEECTTLNQEEECARAREEAVDNPDLSTESTGTTVLEAIIAEGKARKFVMPSPPQLQELDERLEHLEPDLAVYAIEMMDGYGKRAWGPVLNQCRIWQENRIHTRAEAIAEHQARKERLQAHRQDQRNAAPMSAVEFYELVRQQLDAGKTTVAALLALTSRPGLSHRYAPGLTIERRKHLIRMADWSRRTGQSVAI